MRGGIDAAREAGDDDEPGFAQILRERACELASERRRVAPTIAPAFKLRDVAQHGDDGRRRIECGETTRIVRLNRSDQAAADAVEFLDLLARIVIGWWLQCFTTTAPTEAWELREEVVAEPNRAISCANVTGPTFWVRASLSHARRSASDKARVTMRRFSRRRAALLRATGGGCFRDV